MVHYILVSLFGTCNDCRAVQDACHLPKGRARRKLCLGVSLTASHSNVRNL